MGVVSGIQTLVLVMVSTVSHWDTSLWKESVTLCRMYVKCECQANQQGQKYKLSGGANMIYLCILSK